MSLFYIPAYSKKIKIGMTPQQVVEILGEPDHMTQGEISFSWEWRNVPDEDDAVQVAVSFTHGVVSDVTITRPDQTDALSS